jgi:hypothetical protein
MSFTCYGGCEGSEALTSDLENGWEWPLAIAGGVQIRSDPVVLQHGLFRHCSL